MIVGKTSRANPPIMAKRSFLDKEDINITTAAKPMIPIKYTGTHRFPLATY